MALLGRDQILAAQDLPTVDVEVPEWGGTVRVRMMTGGERDAFEAGTITRHGRKIEQNLVNIRARLVALCVVDEKGQRLFSEADAVALGQKSAAALNRVFNAAQQLNALTEEAAAAAEEQFPDAA